MLLARTLHWFNPVAWWTVREMQAEREAACDELAFTAMGEADRSEYAATIVELAASLAPSAIAPGLIGLYASTRRLKKRIERLLRSPSVATLRTPIASILLLGMALTGLTDAMPGARAQSSKEAASTGKEEPKANSQTIGGRCVDADGSALAGVSVRLYRVEGRISPPVEIARTETGVDGRYTFTGLAPERGRGHLDLLEYGVLGFLGDRPIGIPFMHFDGEEEVVTIRFAVETSTLSGKVIDADGRPVAQATVTRYWIGGRPIAGLLATTTDVAGRFHFDDMPVYKTPDGRPWGTSFTVRHPDHPETFGKADALPAEVVVRLPASCSVTGTVTDGVTARPAAGAIITARRVDEWGESFAEADAAGRFRLVVAEGRYDFLADAEDRVTIAVTGRECLDGEKVELPPLKLIGGGFISGRVINTATGQSVSVTGVGEPVTLGLSTSAQPHGAVIAQTAQAEADKAGRFILRRPRGNTSPTWSTLVACTWPLIPASSHRSS